VKVLMNASNLVKGGALQAAASFILASQSITEIKWHYAISENLRRQLDSFDTFRVGNDEITVFDRSPAQSMSGRKKLKNVEIAFEPNLVFTFFGPAYVEFDCPHLLGFAEPLVTHGNRHAWNTIPGFHRRVIRYLSIHYKRHWLGKANYWVVEAEVARQGILRLQRCAPEKVLIVENGCRDEVRSIRSAVSALVEHEEIRLLYLSAFYPHKNFLFIPEVAARLKCDAPEYRIRFVLSLDRKSADVAPLLAKIEALNVESYFDFLGQVPLKDVPQLYQRCHIAFIPTLLESFSATYSEAMACGMPVITSDMNFSRPLCKDAAEYFAPNNVDEATRAILRIIKDKNYRELLIQRGHEIADQLPDANTKCSQYVSIIKRMAFSS